MPQSELASIASIAELLRTRRALVDLFARRHDGLAFSGAPRVLSGVTKVFVHPSLDEPSGFRVTTFDGYEVSGHVEFATYRAAVACAASDYGVDLTKVEFERRAGERA